MQLSKVVVFPLPEIYDERGNLSVFENNKYFPFEIEWVSWLSVDAETTSSMAFAYTTSSHIIVALSGSMDLLIREGDEKKEVTIGPDCNCIFLPSLIWYQVKHCSNNTTAFIAADKITNPEGGINNLLLQHKKFSNEKYQLFD